MYRAAYKDHPSVVRLLLAAAADPSARTDHGKTALLCARENGFAETAAALQAYERQDLQYIEAIKTENAHAAAGFLTLPDASQLTKQRTA